MLPPGRIRDGSGLHRRWFGFAISQRHWAGASEIRRAGSLGGRLLPGTRQEIRRVAAPAKEWRRRGNFHSVTPVSDVTRILDAMQSGDPLAAEDLLDVVYRDLRRIAASLMSREPPGHTLQPTALVHEAWMRLESTDRPPWRSRADFFGAAGEAMRRILVEAARRKGRLKRGGALERVEWEESRIEGPADDDKILQVHEALEALSATDPEMARIVVLRFFVGLGNEEIAAILEVSEKTVRRHWEMAKVRLLRAILSR